MLAQGGLVLSASWPHRSGSLCCGSGSVQGGSCGDDGSVWNLGLPVETKYSLLNLELWFSFDLSDSHSAGLSLASTGSVLRSE